MRLGVAPVAFANYSRRVLKLQPAGRQRHVGFYLIGIALILAQSSLGSVEGLKQPIQYPLFPNFEGWSQCSHLCSIAQGGFVGDQPCVWNLSQCGQKTWMRVPPLEGNPRRIGIPGGTLRLKRCLGGTAIFAPIEWCPLGRARRGVFLLSLITPPSVN